MPTTIDLSLYLSVPQAAAELGVTRARVHHLIAAGDLGECRPPDDLIPVWLVPKSGVAARNSAPVRKGGWPKGKPRKALRKSKKSAVKSR